MKNPTQIQCPECNHQFDVENALSHDIEDKLKKEYQEKLQKATTSFSKREKAFLLCRRTITIVLTLLLSKIVT